MGAILSREAQGGDGSHERTQADHFAQLRGEAKEKSQQCYHQGDHQGAAKWKKKGNEYDALVREWNGKAERAIFEHHNSSSEEGTIDLHGLHVSEAKQRVRKLIDKSSKSPGKQKTLKIIVGRGNHSEGGLAKIKPAVTQMLEESQLKWHQEPGNPGCLIVEVEQRKQSLFRQAIGRIFGFLCKS